MTGLAVVILAGGEATRFPHKLERDAGGEPLLMRAVRNLAPLAPLLIAANERGCGPMLALRGAMSALSTERVFAVAGDAPFVDAKVFSRLNAAWSDGVEAVLAQRSDGGLEPLCALYDRVAFLQKSALAMACGESSVRSVVARMVHVGVPVDDLLLVDVDTPAQLAALFTREHGS